MINVISSSSSTIIISKVINIIISSMVVNIWVSSVRSATCLTEGAPAPAASRHKLRTPE